MEQSQGGQAVNDHIGDSNKMINDTPISDSTPHNVADLAMLCRRFERFAAGREAYIKQLETENDALRADLLLWNDKEVK
jgi:hypothetical protein